MGSLILSDALNGKVIHHKYHVTIIRTSARAIFTLTNVVSNSSLLNNTVCLITAVKIITTKRNGCWHIITGGAQPSL